MWQAFYIETSDRLLIILIGISIWRKQLKIDYTQWRIWHGILATLVVALAIVHVMLVGHYLNTLWKQVLWTAYGFFWVALLVYTRIFKPFQLLRTPYEVESVSQERGNVFHPTTRT